MQYLDILIETASEYFYYGRSLPYLSKTKLLKLTYLVEYFYYKHHQKRLSDADWIFYLYGPYLYNYEESLKRSPFSIEVAEEEGEYKVIVRDEEYFRRERITDYDILQIVKKVVVDFGKNDLNEILDFIYFETEPILNAQNRCERLDFSSIGINLPTVKQKLSKMEIDNIIRKHSQRLENARRI